MTGIFKADDVFQMAMHLEQVGQSFYQDIAQAASVQEVAELCTRLAAMEAEHYKLFQRMREEMVRPIEIRHLGVDERAFIDALLADKVALDIEQAKQLAAQGKLAPVLDMAIQMEKDSVLFYSGMLSAVSETDAESINKIIAEEKSHVRELVSAKQDLK